MTATRLPTRIRDWLEQRLPPRLLGVVDWPAYRLAGRCWAEGCGRRMVAHTPRRLRRCERTPLAVQLTEQGIARTVVWEAEALTAKAANQ